MNLSYRGNRYRAEPTTTPTVDTGRTAQFLGKAYPIRQPLQPAGLANGSLTYRGVTY